MAARLQQSKQKIYVSVIEYITVFKHAKLNIRNSKDNTKNTLILKFLKKKFMDVRIMGVLFIFVRRCFVVVNYIYGKSACSLYYF